MRQYILFAALIFALGWATSNAYSAVSADYDLNLDSATFVHPIASNEQDSPADRIKESQIHVYDDMVVIEIENPEWSRFTDTNSMDPVLDYGANAIHMVPSSEDELHVGDIVAYDSEYSDATIIHRIIEIGHDEKGTYYILKGDNNPTADPGKVRFEQIQRVLVAVIY